MKANGILAALVGGALLAGTAHPAGGAEEVKAMGSEDRPREGSLPAIDRARSAATERAVFALG